MIVLLVKNGTSFTPGIGGTSARAPTSRKILSACSRRLFADTVRGAVNAACPRTRDTFLIPAIHLARPSVDCLTTVSLRFFTAGMSTRTLPAEKPKDTVVKQSTDGLARWIAGMRNVSLVRGH